ncbi:MAG: phosphodiester glycosidase family protein [Anaerolineae bacterium]|nr:phosphodiester glycosidase family protein [Anaerolineae bacterium]
MNKTLFNTQFVKWVWRFTWVGIVLSVGILSTTILAILMCRPPRSDCQEILFKGVSYQRQSRSFPRPLMIHIIEIDLTASGIDFLVTPADEESNRELSATTTSEFLEKYALQIAINGDFFSPFYVKSFMDYYPHIGDPVDVSGLAISNGEKYSEDTSGDGHLCIMPQIIQIRQTSCPDSTQQALSGNWVFVDQGRVAISSQYSYHNDLHPRTVVAVDEAGKTLWLIVVDGRQPGYSEGVNMEEMANIVLSLGAYTALNLDGGGSSTLVVSWNGRTKVFNAPIHTRIPMRQRPIANHLGVYALPLE